jgi:hypothetical protein
VVSVASAADTAWKGGRTIGLRSRGVAAFDERYIRAARQNVNFLQNLC